MSRVLVAIDESPTSQHAARVAAALFSPEQFPPGPPSAGPPSAGPPSAGPAARAAGIGHEILALNVAQMIVPWVAPGLGFGAVAPLGDPMVDARTGMADEDVRTTAAAVGLEPDAVLDDVGMPAERIVAAAEEHDVDVVVVGSHHRSFFERLLTGSVSEDVLHRSHRPVLVVREGSTIPSPGAGILIAVEDDADGERVAEVAARLFGRDRRLYLLHVIPAAPLGDNEIWTASVRAASDPGGERTAGLEPSFGTRLADDAHELLEGIRDRARLEDWGAEVDLVVDVGDPQHTIEDRAETLDVAAIVVGATKEGWFGRTFGTPVADALVRAGSRPVLVV